LPGASRPSREVVASAEYYVPARPRLLGSPWVTVAGLFPCSLRRLTHRPFPGPVRIRLRLLSLKANSPSEFLLLNHCFRLSTSATTYLGFGPLPDITVARPLTQGFQAPTLFRPQALSASRRLTPLYSLQAYFIPHAEVQDHFPFRGFPLHTAVVPHRNNVASMSLERGVLTRKRAATNQAPQLRGFAPCGAACRRFGN